MRVDLQFVLVILCALFIGSLLWLVRHRRDLRLLPANICWGVAALFVLSVILRLVFTTPALIHGSIDHAPNILEAVISFPGPNAYRSDTYGFGSLALLGTACALFGRTAETLFAANVLVSALSIWPLAYVAARWSGRHSAALYAAAAWAASPVVARVAHSEDAHVVATAYALFALAWLELAFARGSRLALLNGALAAVLAVLSRQTLHPWAALCCALLLERWWRARSTETPGRRLGLVSVALAIGFISLPFLRFLLASNLGQGSNLYVLMAYTIMLERPAAIVESLMSHPLFGVPSVSVLFPTAGLLGLASMLRRRSPIRWAVPISFAVLAFVTLPFALPVPGDSWIFRFPLYALGMILTGVGVAAFDGWLQRRAPTRLRVPALTIGVVLLALSCRATLDNLKPNPEFVEYRFVRDLVEAAPRPLTLIGTTGVAQALGSRPGIRFVEFSQLDVSQLTTPWIFVDGRACHVHFPLEFFWARRHGEPDFQGLLRDWFNGFHIEHRGSELSLVHVWTRQARATAQIPQVPMRDECAEALALVSKLSSAEDATWINGPVVAVEDQLPFFAYDRNPLPLRVLRATAPRPLASVNAGP